MAKGPRVVQMPNTKKKSVLIIDSEVNHSELGVVHFYLTAEGLIQQLNTYTQTLNITRGIIDKAINVSDPVFIYIRDNNPWLKEVPNGNELTKMYAESHYEQLKASAANEAAMLALFSSAKNNHLFEVAPQIDPNEIDAKEEIPGALKLPPVRRELRNPVEARLVRIYEIIFSDPSFQAVLDNVMVQIGDRVSALSGGIVETSEDGFRS